jgi:hypothetical protein
MSGCVKALRLLAFLILVCSSSAQTNYNLELKLPPVNPPGWAVIPCLNCNFGTANGVQSLTNVSGSPSGTVTNLGGGTWGIGTNGVGGSTNLPVPLIINVANYGASPTNADNTTAFNNALQALISLSAVGGEIQVPYGKYTISNNLTIVYPPGLFGIDIVGQVQDGTILYWPASSGLTFDCSNYFHSVHLKNLTLSTGSATSAYYAVTVNQQVLEGPFAQSDIENVTVRGDDGGQATDYWGIGIYLNGLSDMNFDNVLLYGPSAGTTGAGVILSGNASISPYYGIVHNFSKCGFFNLGIGLQLTTYIQGVTVSQCNFVNGTTGIYLPSNGVGFAQLTVSASEFNTTANQINMQSPIASLIANGNLFYVPTNACGILFASTGFQNTIVGNVFSGEATNGSSGIIVQGTVSDSLVEGNVFYLLNNGVNLTGGTNWNVQANVYQSVKTNVVGIGSFNSVGKVTY